VHKVEVLAHISRVDSKRINLMVELSGTVDQVDARQLYVLSVFFEAKTDGECSVETSPN